MKSYLMLLLVNWFHHQKAITDWHCFRNQQQTHCLSSRKHKPEANPGVMW